jgi:hypothetical protein
MPRLKRFTTQYQSAEDRILLTGELQSGDVVSFWFTQRLLLRAVPALIEWLQKHSPADLKAADNASQAREMTKVFSRKPVQPKAAGAAAADPERIAVSDPAIELPRLVHSIDFGRDAKVLRLRFRDSEQVLAELALTGNQVRQWLAILHVFWKNAGWPPHVWPRWLRDDIELVSNVCQGTVH